jgi:hypothetical protein
MAAMSSGLHLTSNIWSQSVVKYCLNMNRANVFSSRHFWTRFPYLLLSSDECLVNVARQIVSLVAASMDGCWMPQAACTAVGQDWQLREQIELLCLLARCTNPLLGEQKFQRAFNWHLATMCIGVFDSFAGCFFFLLLFSPFFLPSFLPLLYPSTSQTKMQLLTAWLMSMGGRNSIHFTVQFILILLFLPLDACFEF